MRKGGEDEHNDHAAGKPPLEHMLNLADFEGVAQAVMPRLAWNYYSSGADDEITMRANRTAFHSLWLRPRVLANVAAIDPRTTVLGCPSSFPLSVLLCIIVCY